MSGYGQMRQTCTDSSTDFSTDGGAYCGTDGCTNACTDGYSYCKADGSTNSSAISVAHSYAYCQADSGAY